MAKVRAEDVSAMGTVQLFPRNEKTKTRLMDDCSARQKLRECVAGKRTMEQSESWRVMRKA